MRLDDMYIGPMTRRSLQRWPEYPTHTVFGLEGLFTTNDG